MRALFSFKERPEELTPRLASIEEALARVAADELDEKSIPVLLWQLFKLNGSLLVFAYAPKFQYPLHAMIRVDLKQASALLLKRYMGRANIRNSSMI